VLRGFVYIDTAILDSVFMGSVYIDKSDDNSAFKGFI
jgi:hypothetical protein